MEKLNKFFKPIALVLAFSPLVVNAQIVNAIVGERAATHISTSEYTLISVEGSQIARIDGQDFLVNPEADTNFGKLFIKPENPKKPFTLFVTDKRNRTFVLYLTPDEEMKGSFLRIKDVSPIQTVLPDTPLAMSAADSRVEVIHTMTKQMLQDKSPSDMTVNKMNKKFQWWVESSVHQVREYQYKHYIGKVYVLKNTSKKKMVLTEDEFYSDGVVSIALSKPVLKPDESIRIAIIYEKAGI